MAKRLPHFLYPAILIATLALTYCTLDKEPLLPTATNEKAPIFLSENLTPITHDSLRAKARLSARGNLNILHYGWVWSENPVPTLQDSTLELGPLAIDSFETLIPGLILGKTYHLRPYVLTCSGETYGPEQTIFMGIPKLNDIALVADSACFLRVQCNLQNPLPLLEYGIVYLAGAGTPTLQKKDGQASGSGLSNGSFQADLTMLNPNTAYSLRAYAKTASGTGYSRAMPVTTPTSSLLAANFSINTDAELFQGAIVQFTNTSIGAIAYSWSFGDGETAAEDSPVHIFNNLGNMTVRLTAENGGCMLTKDTLLKIIPDPFQDYWVDIPGGTFMMGCTAEQEPDCQPDEYPAHQVTLSPFFMGKTEITQGQWLAVTGNNPSYFYQCGLDCPVETVSWERIVNEFIPALNRKTGLTHRLPTEAEWEYAARGGQAIKYAGSDNSEDVGWYADNSGGETHPVRQKYVNGFGLYDMSGNIWEWCNDRYSDDYYAVNPSTTPSVLSEALTVCSVAGRGSIVRLSAGSRIATGTIRALTAPITVFVWPGTCNTLISFTLFKRSAKLANLFFK